MFNVRASFTLFLILFFLGMPFGVLEILSFGKFKFFSRWILPKLGRAFWLLFKLVPAYVLWLAGAAFVIWFLVFFWQLAIVLVVLYWCIWFVTKLRAQVKVAAVTAHHVNTCGDTIPSYWEWIVGLWPRGQNVLRKGKPPGPRKIPGLEDPNLPLSGDDGSSVVDFDDGASVVLPGILMDVSKTSAALARGESPLPPA